MIRAIAVFICSLVFMPLHAERVEITLWHAMAGHLGNELQVLVDGFNQSQDKYYIKPAYKGNYIETLTSFAAAFRAHKSPDLVQIFEVGTANMLAPKGIIKPVGEIMQSQGQSLPVEDFLPSVRAFYSRDGVLQAMPFNISTPVMYYNKDILAKVGYENKHFPKTWDDMEVLASTLKRAGYKCVYTSANSGWVLVESYAAIHGIPLAKQNPERAAYNTVAFLNHFQRLKRWQKMGYFRYGGRVDDATFLFTSGRCPLYSQSSGSFNSLTEMVPFKVGVAPLPLDKKASTVRHTNIIGGAALWAVTGQSDAHYKGIAAFFSYLAKPDIQRYWHEHTGYLPLGLKGQYEVILKNSKHPNLKLAHHDLERDGANNQLVFFGPLNQVRIINDAVLEAMFANLMTPKDALNGAINRANHAILRFTLNTEQKK